MFTQPHPQPLDPARHRGWRRRCWVGLLPGAVLLFFAISEGLVTLRLASPSARRQPALAVLPASPVKRAGGSGRAVASIHIVNEQPTVDPAVINAPSATLLLPVVTLIPWLTATVDAPTALVTLPTLTPEPLPTAPPPPSPLPPAAPVALEQPVQSFVELTGLRHYWQTWNNCGPATLAMNLSYYGAALDQSDIGQVLRTHDDDKNVKPAELVDFARSQGFQAAVRVNGNTELLRRLVSNGLPVLIETWAVPEPDNGLGHYRLITGYNDAEQAWIAYDSLIAFGLLNPAGDYRGIRVPYSEFDGLWSVFNRLYILVYPAEQAALVQSILGDNFAPAATWQQALLPAQTTTQQQPEDAFAWFSLGSTLVALADYPTAAAAFDRARQLGLPRRMDWYQYEPLQAYYAVGRYADVLDITAAVLAQTPSIEDIHYWRGQALAAQGQTDAARQAWQQALDLNPTFAPARTARAAP